MDVQKPESDEVRKQEEENATQTGGGESAAEFEGWFILDTSGQTLGPYLEPQLIGKTASSLEKFHSK